MLLTFNIHGVIYLYIFLILIMPLFLSNLSAGAQSYPSYILYFFLLLFLALMQVVKPIFTRTKIYQIVDWIPYVFLLTWLYGGILGLVLENDFLFIVRNFAGMIFYSFYYILLLMKIRKSSLVKVILFSGLFYSIGSIAIFLFYIPSVDIIQFGIGRQRLLSSVGAIVAFPLLSIILANVLDQNLNSNSDEKLRNWFKILFSKPISPFVLIFLLFTTIILPLGKGNALGFLFIIGVLLLNKVKNFRSVVVKLLFLAVLSLSLVLINNQLSDLLGVFNVFSGTDPSNILRFEQFKIMISDLTFFGKGLGGTIKGYARGEFAYGFEISYLNLIHKFGFFSIFLFIGYAFCIVLPINRIFKNVNKNVNYLVIGLMTFLFPALGNPMLFSASSCMMHCIAMYFLRDEEE